MSTNLEEPYEYLDLHPGDNFTLRVESYRDGTAVIHPKSPTPRHVAIHMDQKGLAAAPAAGTPISITVPVLRLYGERVDQPSTARYYDISSKTLRADLIARLDKGLLMPFLLSLSASGHAPQKRYSVTINRA